MGLKKKDYTMRGLVLAPLAFLVGGPVGAAASVVAGYALGDAKEKEIKRRMAEVDRENKRRSEEIWAKQKADRERVEDYAAEEFEREFTGAVNYPIDDKLRDYFKDIAKVWDMSTTIGLSLYRPEYKTQKNKCQIGKLFTTIGDNTEPDFINFNSNKFIQQYELYKSVEGAIVKVHVYNASGGGYGVVMKITLPNGMVKKFCCLPRYSLF